MVSLQKALHKLDLDDASSRRLDRLLKKELGYAARLRVRVLEHRSDDDVEFFGGFLDMTLETTTLTTLQALEMCDVLDRCELKVERRRDGFARGSLSWEISAAIMDKFPERTAGRQGRALPAGAVLALPTGDALRLCSRPVGADEHRHFSRLIGFCTKESLGALRVRWHASKERCEDDECYRCFPCGKPGRWPVLADLEDATLQRPDGEGPGWSSDDSDKFYPTDGSSVEWSDDE